jgi:cytochrome c
MSNGKRLSTRPLLGPHVEQKIGLLNWLKHAPARSALVRARPLFTVSFALLLSLTLALMLGLAMPASAQTAQNNQTGSLANGQMIFESRCIACHSLDTNRVGPALQNVVGRVAGKAADFSYSTALGQAKHVWTRDKLLAWLEDTQAVVPGNVMGYQVPMIQDRLDVVAYLAAQSRKPASSPAK